MIPRDMKISEDTKKTMIVHAEPENLINSIARKSF